MLKQRRSARRRERLIGVSRKAKGAQNKLFYVTVCRSPFDADILIAAARLFAGISGCRNIGIFAIVVIFLQAVEMDVAKQNLYKKASHFQR